jgi:hypothetical protein
MTKNKGKSSARACLNPASEKLLSKITNLEENLQGIKAQDLSPDRQHLVTICETYLETARDFLDRPILSCKFPFYESRHPHLIWEMLHRVDEYFILLIKDAELYSKATYVKNSFELNIKEDKVREEWIGQNGKLKEALDDINKRVYKEDYRYVVKDALNLVNEQVDRSFWQVSMNTLTSVCSGTILGILMLLAWIYCTTGLHPHTNALNSLNSGGLSDHYLTLIILGLMGSYLSNLMTNENFLYIQGAPYWRYFLHNLFSKPLMSGFAAVFIYILARSKLIFSITAIAPTETSKAAVSQLINLNVSPEGVGYVYAILAVVSGFAADKILRNMIDKVLKKLEQKAEKSKDSEKKEEKKTDPENK